MEEEDLLRNHIDQNKILMMKFAEDVFKVKNETGILDEVGKMIEEKLGMLDEEKINKIQCDIVWPVDKVFKSILETIRDEMPPKIVANRITTCSAKLFSLKELQDLCLI